MPVQSTISVLLFTAAFVGFAHSMAPGHWLPVVLMAKGQRWGVRNAILGAAVAASGHVFISALLGLASIPLGAHLFTHHEETIERYSGLALAVFGALYAIYAYFRHSSCHGHEHHGPDPEKNKKRTPFVFLFMVGFSPCVAVLPVFAAASAMGTWPTLGTMFAFSIGVLAALIGSTVVTALGLMKLDHPIFEHYGDVLTGAGLAIMGIVLFFLGHGHEHLH